MSNDDSDTATESRIQRLDQATVERIAAGEVVERPASVVKELVENSLDAGATQIDVTVEGDGTDLVRVQDDGRGMTEADVRAAVQEHTTSKIDDIEDLETGLETLGFRGEALHTIGAVSRVTITTKPRDGDRGTRLRYVGGEVESVEPAGCPEGTTVEVEDLFFNTPARRKYLKQASTEFAHSNRVVSRYALANPDVAMSLTHDDRETFSTTGQNNLRATILSVYGREVAEAMLPVHAGDIEVASDLPESGGDGSVEAPIQGIAGYVSHPETTRSSAHYVVTFVNGRYVDAVDVRDAIVDAYGARLKADRYPFAAVFLSVPPESVDVNVHPRKRRIRFDDTTAVKRVVQQTVHDALIDHGLEQKQRHPQPSQGRSGSPERPLGDAEEGAESASSAPSQSDSTTAQEADSSGPTPADRSRSEVDVEESASSPESSAAGGASTSGGRSAGSEGVPDSSGGDHPSQPTTSAAADTDEPTDVGAADPGGDEALADEDMEPTTKHLIGDPDEYQGPVGRSSRGSGSESLAAYSGESGEASLPAMRVLDTLHERYLVAESDAGLVLVDREAAAARVVYERLQAQLPATSETRSLADPVEIALSEGEAAALEAAAEAIDSLGFELSVSEDDQTVAVTAVPAPLGPIDPDALQGLLDDFVGSDPRREFESVADRFVAHLAHHRSLLDAPPDRLSVGELLEALDGCLNPFESPLGHPVVVTVDVDEIEARFERDYPGHPG